MCSLPCFLGARNSCHAPAITQPIIWEIIIANISHIIRAFSLSDFARFSNDFFTIFLPPLPLSTLAFALLFSGFIWVNFHKFPLNMFMFLCVQLRHVSLVSRSNCRSCSLSLSPSLSLFLSQFCKILCLFCNCHLAFFCPLHRTHYVCFSLSLLLSLLHVKLATSFGVY